jgi:hypothetical protein
VAAKRSDGGGEEDAERAENDGKVSILPPLKSEHLFAELLNPGCSLFFLTTQILILFNREVFRPKIGILDAHLGHGG